MILTPDNVRIMHSFKCILAGHYLSLVSRLRRLWRSVQPSGGRQPAAPVELRLRHSPLPLDFYKDVKIPRATTTNARSIISRDAEIARGTFQFMSPAFFRREEEKKK